MYIMIIMVNNMGSAICVALWVVATTPLAHLAMAAECESLKSLLLPNTQIESAELVPPEKFAGRGGLPVEVTVSLCQVGGAIKPTPMSSVKFEVMMPATGWNGRFVQVGNGGLAGSIWTPVIAGQVSEGYAAAGTDDGSGPEGSLEWLSDRERVTDFGYRAVTLRR
jgi:feruloyl esterase